MMQPKDKTPPETPQPAGKLDKVEWDIENEPFVIEECGDTLWEEALKNLDRATTAEEE